MGLFFSKRMQDGRTQSKVVPGPRTADGDLIIKCPEAQSERSQSAGQISDWRRRILIGFAQPIYVEPQRNTGGFIEVPDSTPTILIRNEELVPALLQHLKVPHRQCFPHSEPLSLEPILPGSACYNFVMEKFSNGKFMCTYTVLDVQRVWNPHLMVQYMLTKEKGKNHLVERYLFHGTSQKALSGVLKDNFNWRKTVMGKWGRGVSFANNPWYSSHYSKLKRQSKNYPYVMVLAKVLMETGEICEGDSSIKVPPTGYTAVNPTKEVIVKFDDASFYPEFIVYYEETFLWRQYF